MTPNGVRLPIELRQISQREPHNLIFPFFSKRKSVSYEETFNASTSLAVSDNFIHIYARVSRLLASENEANAEFNKYCEAILGRRISTMPSTNGSVVGLYLGQDDYIPLSDMGEGTANIVGLIADLCLAKKNIFLIEELENDIHPNALKALLDIICEKSKDNQFFISTHSNIVLRHLGAIKETKIFALSMEYAGKLPWTTGREVGEIESDRQEILTELGYEPFDFGLWKAYLMLEESSAESIINQVLIPHFVPALQGRLRTISAGGANNVEALYADFHRLFIFVHTSEIYHKLSWVRVDGDEPGKSVIKKLKEKFPSIHQDRFGTYLAPGFEKYYPARFQEEVKQLQSIVEKATEEKRQRCVMQKGFGLGDG